MNKNLQNKIKTYTGVVSAILAADKASGQVVYVNIIPDAYKWYSMDLGNDNIYDFVFTDSGSGNSCSGIYSPFHFYYASVFRPLNQNKVGSNNYNFWVRTVPWGNMINVGAFASGQRNISTSYKKCNGSTGTAACYAIGQDFYVPFIYKFQGGDCFGWVRLKISSNGASIIKDYAYQTHPNVPIIAGDTTDLIYLSNNEINFEINFTQQNNSIHILSNQQMKYATISVFDLLGKEILQQRFSGKVATINIDRKGIYIVEVKSDNVNWKKKVFVY